MTGTGPREEELLEQAEELIRTYEKIAADYHRFEDADDHDRFGPEEANQRFSEIIAQAIALDEKMSALLEEAKNKGCRKVVDLLGNFHRKITG